MRWWQAEYISLSRSGTLFILVIQKYAHED